MQQHNRQQSDRGGAALRPLPPTTFGHNSYESKSSHHRHHCRTCGGRRRRGRRSQPRRHGRQFTKRFRCLGHYIGDGVPSRQPLGEPGTRLRSSPAGTKERILVDAKGDPLYTYQPDTATKSLVSGQLAALWPPLVAKAPAIRGATGMLTTVSTTNGQQVAYNGHFLYTFVEDKPGQVTGQGVQDFYVATPDIKAFSASSSAPAPTGMGY